MTIIAGVLGRIAVLQIGTHRTGTTSLQTMVARYQQWFRDQGLYYPLTTRGSSSDSDGHHNLARELNDDDRYDPGKGSLADLVKELRLAQARSVLLSSGDFEYLYRKPLKLDILRASLAQLG